jgi:hypothetical protein
LHRDEELDGLVERQFWTVGDGHAAKAQVLTGGLENPSVRGNLHVEVASVTLKLSFDS